MDSNQLRSKAEKPKSHQGCSSGTSHARSIIGDRCNSRLVLASKPIGSHQLQSSFICKSLNIKLYTVGDLGAVELLEAWRNLECAVLTAEEESDIAMGSSSWRGSGTKVGRKVGHIERGASGEGRYTGGDEFSPVQEWCVSVAVGAVRRIEIDEDNDMGCVVGCKTKGGRHGRIYFGNQ